MQDIQRSVQTIQKAFNKGGRGHAEGTHDRKPPDLGTWPHDLLVASMAGNAILKYDWRGNFVGDFVPPGSGGLTGPVGLDYGPGPNYDVYVSVYGGGVLRYASSSGAFLGTLVPAGSEPKNNDLGPRPLRRRRSSGAAV